MNRRCFIAAVAGAAVAAPFAAAQSVAKRIGWLVPEVVEDHSRAFRGALRALGYIEGQTVRFEARSANGDLDRLPRLATELVSSRPDVIVAVTTPAILAARSATDTIPIVMAFWGGRGLIESGIVASLARPGGNVTGVYVLGTELDAKRVQLLLQVAPKARKIGVLYPGKVSEEERVAEVSGVELRVTEVGRNLEDYNRAFEAMAEAGVEALLVPGFPRFVKEIHQITELAATRHVPAMYEWPSMAEEGGLMSYGPSLADLEDRAASFVDRILKGAKPGNLPVEQPTKFELIINLKTAASLGLTIPKSLLLRADKLIQ
jgi:putative ABC transport system substrate-binding protein